MSKADQKQFLASFDRICVESAEGLPNISVIRKLFRLLSSILSFNVRRATCHPEKKCATWMKAMWPSERRAHVLYRALGKRKQETVTAMTDAYDDEGYASMSMDTYRNRYFIQAIMHARKNGASRFLEIGPGADAKLTQYVLNVDDRLLRPPSMPVSVTAIEVNPKSFTKAQSILGDRANLVLGDAVEVLKTNSNSFDCMLAEVIGFIASCEGQCRLLRAVAPHMGEPMCIPQIFGTYLCAYSGNEPAVDAFHRCRHVAFHRFYKKAHVNTHARLTMEEWNANEVCMSNRTDYTFDTSMEVTDACALVGFIELRQITSEERVMCSSAPWETRKHRAENWDVFIIPLKSRISGPIRLRSSPHVFSAQPSYDLEIHHGGSVTYTSLTLDNLLECVRLGGR